VSRLIFLDSSVNTHGDRTRVLLPARAFSASGNEQMSITLQSFSIRRNWYNINPTNNTGFIFVDNTYFEFSIDPGLYASFAPHPLAFDLASAIQAGLANCITSNTTLGTIVSGVTCSYSIKTRLFTIVFTKQSGQTAKTVEIRCFAVKDMAHPQVLTQNGAFNDLFEILGARPIRSFANAENSLRLATGSAANQDRLISRYPASLNTLDAIYIHLPALETGNFMSTGLESHIAESQQIVESSIFARIPFANATFDETHEVVQFEDTGGDAFQSMLTRKSLDNLDIRITDGKGRSLANIDPSQSDLGLLSYKMALRFDIFIPPQPKEPSHGVARSALTHLHPPSVAHS
jgi:hypothetical protein